MSLHSLAHAKSSFVLSHAQKFELRHSSSFQEQTEEQYVHCWAWRKACHALYTFCLNSFNIGPIIPVLSPQLVAQL